MVERARVGGRKDLGQMLVEGAFLKPQELEQAREIARTTGKKLTQVLLEKNMVSPQTLATMLSFQLGLPIIDLQQIEVQPEALALIPEDVAREHGVLPIKIEGDTLVVAMEDPTNIEALDTIAAISHKRIRPVIPISGGVMEAIKSHYKLTHKIQEEVSQVVSEARPPTLEPPPVEPALEADVIAQAPIVRAVDMILTQAVKDRASDIHIEPQEDSIRIRYRIDGILHDSVTLPKGVHSALISRIKVMANMNIAERRRPQDGQFSATIAGRQIDFRVATAETANGEMAVLRVLDKSLAVLKLSEVGMLPNVLEQYRRFLDSPFGLILVSGPTGSGKTTTLYASVGELDPHQKNIMTIENPIEYHFKGINQIQVNPQAGVTFAKGLRAIMRLDPDVILVGEIRDAETANVAVQAALTGHLVLTSIHANDSVSAILRLVDLGVEPFLVTAAVICSLSQRLVRKVCPYCKSLGPVSPAEAMAYQEEMQEIRTEFYYGRGCNFCSRSGFLGRIGVFEMMPVSDTIRQQIIKQATSAEIKAQAVKEGMITLRRDGMIKARDGITTPGEVLRNVFLIV